MMPDFNLSPNELVLSSVLFPTTSAQYYSYGDNFIETHALTIYLYTKSYIL